MAHNQLECTQRVPIFYISCIFLLACLGVKNKFGHTFFNEFGNECSASLVPFLYTVGQQTYLFQPFHAQSLNDIIHNKTTINNHRLYFQALWLTCLPVCL